MEAQSMLQPFDKLKADIVVEMAPCLDLKIVDKGSLEMATLEGKKAKHFAKLVEDQRKSLVKPYNDLVKKINDYAKDIMAPVVSAESHIKSEMAKYSVVLEKERLAAQKKLDDERREKQKELDEKHRKEIEEREMAAAFGVDDEASEKREDIIMKASQEREKSDLSRDHKSESNQIANNKVAGERKIWTFEVTDVAQVPRDYLLLNDKLVRDAIGNGVREIPGLRIFQKTSIALR